MAAVPESSKFGQLQSKLEDVSLQALTDVTLKQRVSIKELLTSLDASKRQIALDNLMLMTTEDRVSAVAKILG
ncbi:hypothetical protein ABTE83_19595, partial [Acinetobacter baumannii]